jgi:hypothetical protein
MGASSVTRNALLAERAKSRSVDRVGRGATDGSKGKSGGNLHGGESSVGGGGIGVGAGCW